MRLLYLFLKGLLKITLWIYYPRFRVVEREKKNHSRTIYMSNHAASFMDPLVISALQSTIVFFMTRGDIYKGIMKPIFWAAHMLPIYRQHDNVDTKKENLKSFKRSSNVLSFGRSIIVFAEGFTDDVFIRRLKPIKKGGVRMGFMALEAMNWKKKVYIKAVGVNYSNPNHLGSDCLIKNGEAICLNNYKEQYEENPVGTINSLTRRIEKEMRALITDVRKAELAPFHEHIMRLTRKGMHPVDTDKRLTLEERFAYSKRLADWFNKEKIEDNEELMSLKTRTENYFNSLKQNKIDETALYKVNTNKRRQDLDYPYLFFFFPLMVLGEFFTYIPYKFTKNFIEKSFRRKVFWGSTKMLIGAAFVGIYNFLLLLLVSLIFNVSLLLLLALGTFIVPMLFVMAVNWHKKYKLHKQMKIISRMDVGSISLEREAILKEIYRLIPVE